MGKQAQIRASASEPPATRARRPDRSHPVARDPRREAGFTLIEILVVVVIVGVLALALVLSVAANGERQLERAAERFSALLTHACEQAELGGRELGVLLGADGYAFLRLDGDAWQVLADGGELRSRQWPGGLQLDLAREGRPLRLAAPGENAVPQLVCFSSGELTPFTLELALGDAGARYRIEAGEDGQLVTRRVERAP